MHPDNQKPTGRTIRLELLGNDEEVQRCKVEELIKPFGGVVINASGRVVADCAYKLEIVVRIPSEGILELIHELGGGEDRAWRIVCGVRLDQCPPEAIDVPAMPLRSRIAPVPLWAEAATPQVVP